MQNSCVVLTTRRFAYNNAMHLSGSTITANTINLSRDLRPRKKELLVKGNNYQPLG